MSRLRALLIPLLVAVLLTGCGAVAAVAPQDTPPPTGSRTVDTAFGAVRVPDRPRRVVALGWGDAEDALALGVQPVGASDWLGFGGDGVGPWLEGAYDRPPTILGTRSPDYEQIAALRPDLILDTRSSGDSDRYATLSRIAPTVGVPRGGQQFNTPWRTQVTMIAAALGVPAKGRDLVARTERSLADAAAAHPRFRGRTASVAGLRGNDYGVYVERDSRMRLMAALGFRATPQVAALPQRNYFVPLSRERLGILDADLTVVVAVDGDAQRIREDPVLGRVPSVRDGHLVTFTRDTSRLFSMNTAPSIQRAARELPPLLEDALR